MIESLAIENYKSLRGVELDSLGSINLIIGPNSSGKTSLLQSLFLFCLDAEPRGLSPLARTETEETNLRALESSYQQLFFTRRREPADNVRVTGSFQGINRSVTFRDITRDLYTANAGDNVGPIRFHSADRVEDKAISLNEVIQSAELAFELILKHGSIEKQGRIYFSPQHGIVVNAPDVSSPMIHASITRPSPNPSENLAKLLDQVDDEAELEDVLALLRSVDSRVKDIKIGIAADESPVVRVVHEDLGIVPIHVMGDGFAILLKYALEVGKKRNCIMLDEFDASLHVKSISTMAAFLKQRARAGTQLFLTTHRGDTVEAFVDMMDDEWKDLSVIQLRLVDGVTQAKVFSGDYLREAWEEMRIDLRIPS